MKIANTYCNFYARLYYKEHPRLGEYHKATIDDVPYWRVYVIAIDKTTNKSKILYRTTMNYTLHYAKQFVEALQNIYELDSVKPLKPDNVVLRYRACPRKTMYNRLTT